MNPGEILDNRYQILERLGAGGMGEVYKATHTHLGAPRVIKVVHPHISGNTDAQDRFMREARAATKVHHQNVATLHDFSTLANGSHYMVWEFIDGENLAQKLRSRGTLPPKQAVRIVIQALHGLEAIHRAGIVHRDISPENLMITRPDDHGGSETVKIIDLGVAKIEDSEVSQTRTGIFVGKLRYAAPEQLGFIPEGERIDARADVYSVAMVLVELLTGRPPYEAKSPHEYFILHASQAPPKPVELPAQLPGSAALQQVLDKALARDRNQRYTTAREFAVALEEIERTLPDPREMATMAMPLDGDETMRVKSSGGGTIPDTLHRSTVVTGAQTAVREEPAPTAAPTVLTPLPQQAFPMQQPKQGSLAPLIVIIGLVLVAVAAVVLALMQWPFGAKTTDVQVAETVTAPATTATTPPAKVAETSVDVASPVTTTTAPPVLSTTTPTIIETTTTAAPPPPRELTPPRKTDVIEKPKPAPPKEAETPAEEPPRTFGGPPTYVDGGEDSEANERALDYLRRQIRGTRVVAIRAPGMQLELARALRERFPNLVFEGEADVVIRFNGTMERLGRGRKRRGATATISKGGRVVFRYELPDEVYRVGMSPPDAFARVLADAIEEE